MGAMIRSAALAAMLAGLVPGSANAEDCGGSPCAKGPWLSPAGEWSFVSKVARWTVAVDDSGRFHAEAPRSVVIGKETATYRSTLSGTVSHDRVALSIGADDFSLPNFVPGPPTICTGVPDGPGRYSGRCASGSQRLNFIFQRN